MAELACWNGRSIIILGALLPEKLCVSVLSLKMTWQRLCRDGKSVGAQAFL
jgi:hypothetical protein